MHAINVLKILIVLTAIVLSIYLYFRHKNQSEFSYIKSPYDNRSYVVRNLPDKYDAVTHLSKIRHSLDNLVNHLNTKYIENMSNAGTDTTKVKDKRKDRVNCIRRLYKNYNGDVIAESPKNSTSTSYSINKGEKIYLCIRQRDNMDELIDFNTVTFVALHELAHLMTKTIGHTEEFWSNFKFILEEAIAEGYYEYQDFRKKPVKYCGTTISDTPL
jgi:hypothetical protein